MSEERGKPVIPLPAGVDPDKVLYVAEGSKAARHVDWSKHPRNQRHTNESVRVYVIAQVDGNFVKVGIAHDPVKRLGTVQTGSPVRLTLVGQTDPMTRREAKRVETKVHAALAGKVSVGEWFSCSSDDAIRALSEAL